MRRRVRLQAVPETAGCGELLDINFDIELFSCALVKAAGLWMEGKGGKGAGRAGGGKGDTGTMSFCRQISCNPFSSSKT